MTRILERFYHNASGCFRTLRCFDCRDWLEVVFIVAVEACGALARIMLFPKSSGDINSFLIPWYEYLRDHGGFAAVGDQIGDYTPMYYYFLAALTYTKIPVVIGIKVFSGAFELISAFYVKAILDIEYRHTCRPLLGFALTFLLPTAIINSGAWGQCDGIYTCFVIMSLYSRSENRRSAGSLHSIQSCTDKPQTCGIPAAIPPRRYRTRRVK